MRLQIIVFSAGLLFVTASPAYAYFDTSTFWMILQGGVAIVAAGLVSLKMYWQDVKNYFRNLKRDTPTPGNKSE